MTQLIVSTPQLKAILSELPKNSKHRKIIEQVLANRPKYNADA